MSHQLANVLTKKTFNQWAACCFIGLIFTGDPTNAVLADTVEISGGGHLTGEINRQDDFVVIKVDDDIQIAIPASRVQRVVNSDQLAVYRKAAETAGNDAELHYQLALWCVRSDQVEGEIQKYKNYHMERAVALDPDHSKARAALGFTQENGRWVKTDQLMLERGMIPSTGGWDLPEASAIADFQDALNVDARKWTREVKRLVAVVLRGSSKAPEALASLRAIEDPLAAGAIAQELLESREKGTQSRQLRSLWVGLLGKFRNMTSVEALVRAGLEESDDVIREAALTELVEYGSDSAIATYVQYLTSNDNKTVNRAARCLTWFPETERAITYIKSLVTTHQQEVGATPGMQVGFGESGGGLQMGGKQTPRVERRTNPSVLTLVQSVIPEVDFGYDEKAWLNYIASQRSNYSGDLRRDP
ncbi:HEAT repeat domain-containing protein [Rhodopirellula sp.]|nr:HEAT repeat domain-containing protein [Rhodopirellula sp.]MDB4679002.1 HEAT repeat domain-containing protein [Rhodopirellula sp.]